MNRRAMIEKLQNALTQLEEVGTDSQADGEKLAASKKEVQSTLKYLQSAEKAANVRRRMGTGSGWRK